MQLSHTGRLIQQCWLDIPSHHPYEALDEYIVMPNHFHGIVWISVLALRAAVSEANVTPAAGFLKDSLSSVVASFKSAVTRTSNRRLGRPGKSLWQRSFYDHVIRDDAELQVIRQYIRDNPRKWQIDRENPRHTGVNPFYAWLQSRPLLMRDNS
jgi:REP element-mobilizing transposase RayT